MGLKLDQPLVASCLRENRLHRPIEVGGKCSTWNKYDFKALQPPKPALRWGAR